MNPCRSIKSTALFCFLLSAFSSANNENSHVRSPARSTRRNKINHNKSTDVNHHSNLRRTAEWMGYPRISPQPRIVNGNKASSPDRYPYFVALVDDQERMVCGGTLVASNVVLSAAHCGLTNLKFAIVGKYYGQIDIQHNEAERIPIANTYSNPSFTLRDRSHDQLLVLLETPASGPRPVIRLNLAQEGDAGIPTLTDRVTVLGLGQTYSSSQPITDAPEALQEVTMGVVSNRRCQEMYDEYQYFLPSISDDMVCLLEEGKGQCYGDSGGPYLLLGEKPEDDIQIGTVAWGVDCAREEYPAVGIRTYSADDNFLRDTICAIAANPPAYFGCPTLAPQPVTPPPTSTPSERSAFPSFDPSNSPTRNPSVTPSLVPSTAPTVMDSGVPTSAPSTSPSRSPSTTPTMMDSSMPTTAPSVSPSKSPSTTPTIMDSDLPTTSPSLSPTKVKSEGPSNSPSITPSVMKSDGPSSNPSNFPTAVSSQGPTALPSASPSAVPSTSFPSSSPTTCIVRANPCSSSGGDVCCGTDVCQGGFCRLIPNVSKQSGYQDKNDLKLTRDYSISGVRGGSSFQSIGMVVDLEDADDGES